MKKWLLDTLFALTHPPHWLRNYTTNKTLDAWYNKRINQGVEFTNIGSHYANFGSKRVWIKNQPYACFRINKSMPKRRTVAKLQKLLMLSILESED